MRTARFDGLRRATFAVAMLLLPCGAHAGLVEVPATLTDQATLLNAFSATKTVGAGGPEFTGSFPAQPGESAQSNWSLDVSDTGFALSATCDDVVTLGCDFPQGMTLSLSNLVFSPPASLIGLTGTLGNLPLDGSPQVNPSSVIINFQSFMVGSGGSDVATFARTFQTEPVTEVPEPGTGFLVLLGGLGLSILGLRRARH